MTRRNERLLLNLHTLLLVAVAVGVVVGPFFVLADLQESDDFLDGLGVALGGVMIVGSLLPGAASMLAIRAALKGGASVRRWSVVAGCLGTTTLLLLGLLVWPLLIGALLPLLLVAVAVSSERVAA